ncbi:MAG: beta-ribofuranosylaminobenzene 5'-phosphate synthase family protein [Gammaproteobacteria bacterium]
MSRIPFKVSVIAPARLHMGFIDLSGSLGRHFGSIGVALKEISTRLTVSPADKLRVTGESAARARHCAIELCRQLGVPTRFEIQVGAAIPEHVGLGSGTQMALAIGMALSRFYDLNLSVRDVALLTDRGARSGIGIGVFEHGGLVVDGGRGERTEVPPVLVHMEIPESWRFILVFDRRGQGLHGKQEVNAFRELAPFPEREAARFCYLLLMQALPSLAECDIVPFGDVITQLQKSIGGHFAAAQGGVFASPEVSEAMEWLAARGAVAIGQTSWGPTGFCAVGDKEAAGLLVEDARREFSRCGNLSFISVGARNSGGEVIVERI